MAAYSNYYFGSTRGLFMDNLQPHLYCKDYQKDVI